MRNPDPNFSKQVQRLHQLTVYGRWGFVIFCWLTLGSFGIWGLREEFKLWQQYFTWTAVRYAIAYNIVPATCVFFCIGITGGVLVWQSRNIIYGIPRHEQQRLEKQVEKIRAMGTRHPLWKWVIK